VTDKRERELKLLAVSPEQLDALARRPYLSALPLRAGDEVEQEDLYVDTEDYRLLRAGISLRRRRRETADRVTLKEIPGPRDRALLADRREIEEEVETGDALPDLPDAIAALVRPLVGERPLVPLVRLRTRRRKADLGEPPMAELCLDRVDVLGPDGEALVARFCEVEVEDHGLPEAALSAIGDELTLVHGLQPSGLSKFERGLAARGILAEARGEEETFDTAIRPELRLVDVAYRVFRTHFERMKANEAGTRIGEDPEFLHDMRVSTRRLRAAFRTFRDAFGPKRLTGFNAQLRWIASVLGDVRDLDVYLERLPEYAARLPEADRPALDPYRSDLERRRERARSRMLRALDSRRYESFLDRFDRFLRKGPPIRPSQPAARLPATVAAPRKIRKALKKVLAHGRAIPETDPPPQALHDLRIQCKRLRYTCEFFRPLYGKGMRRFLRSVVELQDLLGAHQDACVAGETLRRSAERLPGSKKASVALALVLGQLVGSQDRSAAASRAGFHAAWEAFDRKRHRRGMWG
jgi:CHAD domain-containing protein